MEPWKTYRDVVGGVTGEESDGTHEVLRAANLADGDQRSPLLLEFWVVVEDLLGPGERVSMVVVRVLVLGPGLGKTYSAVSMYPGEIQLTRMPACAHSTAKLEARCLTAALAAL